MDADEVDDSSPLFSPALYIQRYNKIVDKLVEALGTHIHTMVDLGCSEGKFLTFSRRCLSQLRLLVGVDIDDKLLRLKARMPVPMGVAPIAGDHFRPREKTRLDLVLMHGDISCFDQRLKDLDVVTAIELIEHLKPETLDGFRSTVFGQMRPRVVALTTPNYEYNVFFKDMSEGQFRHWDHKFEWTRVEFEQFCNEIVEEFGNYKVTFDGIGRVAADKDGRFGFCSQMALFVRDDFEANFDFDEVKIDSLLMQLSEDNNEDVSNQYKTIRTHCFPVFKETRTVEERLSDELQYHSRHLAFYSEEWKNDLPAKVDLERLIEVAELRQKFGEDYCQPQNIQGILEEMGHPVLTEDSKMFVMMVPDSNGESQASDDDASDEGEAEAVQNLDLQEEDEDWD